MATAGRIGHALPFLVPNFRVATGLAGLVVAIELLVISWIRNRYMDTPFLRAAFQVNRRRGLCIYRRHPDRKFLMRRDAACGISRKRERNLPRII
jgi:hypothetical protein